MTGYLYLDWCILTEILKWTCTKQWRCSYLLRHEGQIFDNLKKFLSIKVIKIVLDSMLYETLKWPQIAPFYILSKQNPRPPLPLKNYGVHTIKSQLRPCLSQQFNIINPSNMDNAKLLNWRSFKGFSDSGTISQKGLNINGQQFHQYQQNEQSLHVWFRQLKWNKSWIYGFQI